MIDCRIFVHFLCAGPQKPNLGQMPYTDMKSIALHAITSEAAW
jgi:hypothetical protein